MVIELSEFTRQVHFAGLFAVLIIGLQIAGYLEFLYYKSLKEKIGLNKLLLAYGLLFGIGLISVFLRSMGYFYVEDGEIRNLLLNFTHIILFVASISFEFIIATKPFNEILDVRISKIVGIITICLTILIPLSGDEVIQGIFILIAVVVGAVYIIRFHLALIIKSTGETKRRIILITIGAILLMAPLLINAEETLELLSTPLQEFFLLIVVPIMIMGLLIIFFGIFRFPMFLEFHWKRHLIELFILNSESKRTLYWYDFRYEQLNEKDLLTEDEEEIFFTKGIIGIDKIVGAITNTRGEKINKIKQGGLVILVDYDDDPLNFISYILVTSQEMDSIDYFFKSVKNDFRDAFRTILLNLDYIKGKEIELFSSFDKYLENRIKN